MAPVEPAARLDELRRRFAAVLAGFATPATDEARTTSAAQREHLVQSTYAAVHAGMAPGRDGPSSNRNEYWAMAAAAEAELADLDFRHEGMALRTHRDDHAVVRCGDGVEIRIPVARVEPGDGARVTVRIGAVACPAEARWIHWMPPARDTGSFDGRVYLHATAPTALAAWTTVVRLLEAKAVPFLAKVGGSTEMLRRTDSIVVYAAALDLRRVVGVVERSGVADELENDVAGFSHRLRPGIGVALVPSMAGTVIPSVGHLWADAMVGAWLEGGDAGAAAVWEDLTRSWAEAERRLGATARGRG